MENKEVMHKNNRQAYFEEAKNSDLPLAPRGKAALKGIGESAKEVFAGVKPKKDKAATHTTTTTHMNDTHTTYETPINNHDVHYQAQHVPAVDRTTKPGDYPPSYFDDSYVPPNATTQMQEPPAYHDSHYNSNNYHDHDHKDRHYRDQDTLPDGHRYSDHHKESDHGHPYRCPKVKEYQEERVKYQNDLRNPNVPIAEKAKAGKGVFVAATHEIMEGRRHDKYETMSGDKQVKSPHHKYHENNHVTGESFQRHHENRDVHQSTKHLDERTKEEMHKAERQTHTARVLDSELPLGDRLQHGKSALFAAAKEITVGGKREFKERRNNPSKQNTTTTTTTTTDTHY